MFSHIGFRPPWNSDGAVALSGERMENFHGNDLDRCSSGPTARWRRLVWPWPLVRERLAINSSRFGAPSIRTLFGSAAFALRRYGTLRPPAVSQDRWATQVEGVFERPLLDRIMPRLIELFFHCRVFFTITNGGCYGSRNSSLADWCTDPGYYFAGARISSLSKYFHPPATQKPRFRGFCY
jgi:hypothetical protein